VPLVDLQGPLPEAARSLDTGAALSVGAVPSSPSAKPVYAGQARLYASLARSGAARGERTSPIKAHDPMQGVVSDVLAVALAPPSHPPPDPVPESARSSALTAAPTAVASSGSVSTPTRGTGSRTDFTPSQRVDPLRVSQKLVLAPALPISPVSSRISQSKSTEDGKTALSVVPRTVSLVGSSPRDSLRQQALQKLQADFDRPELRTVSSPQGISPRYFRRGFKDLEKDVRQQARTAVERNRSPSPGRM